MDAYAAPTARKVRAEVAVEEAAAAELAAARDSSAAREEDLLLVRLHCSLCWLPIADFTALVSPLAPAMWLALSAAVRHQVGATQMPCKARYVLYILVGE